MLSRSFLPSCILGRRQVASIVSCSVVPFKKVQQTLDGRAAIPYVKMSGFLCSSASSRVDSALALPPFTSRLRCLHAQPDTQYQQLPQDLRPCARVLEEFTLRSRLRLAAVPAAPKGALGPLRRHPIAPMPPGSRTMARRGPLARGAMAVRLSESDLTAQMCSMVLCCYLPSYHDAGIAAQGGERMQLPCNPWHALREGHPAKWTTI